MTKQYSVGSIDPNLGFLLVLPAILLASRLNTVSTYFPSTVTHNEIVPNGKLTYRSIALSGNGDGATRYCPEKMSFSIDDDDPDFKYLMKVKEGDTILLGADISRVGYGCTVYLLGRRDDARSESHD